MMSANLQENIAVPAAPVVGIAALMSAKEIALSALAKATSRVLNLCFDLAADANLDPDSQNMFWDQGSRAVQLMMRIHEQWTWLIQKEPPTIADLNRATHAMQSAATAREAAQANPLPALLLRAVTLTSSALDITDVMLDQVA